MPWKPGKKIIDGYWSQGHLIFYTDHRIRFACNAQAQKNACNKGNGGGHRQLLHLFDKCATTLACTIRQWRPKKKQRGEPAKYRKQVFASRANCTETKETTLFLYAKDQRLRYHQSCWTFLSKLQKSAQCDSSFMMRNKGSGIRCACYYQLIAN